MILIHVSLGPPSVASRALTASWLVAARDDHLSGWSIVLLLRFGLVHWTVGLDHGIWPKPRLARAEPDEFPIVCEDVAFVSSNLVSSP